MDTKKIIEDQLIEMGFVPSLRGFYCITHAVNYFLENNKECYEVSLCSDVYKYVAEKMNIKKHCVERDIRTSVENVVNVNPDSVKYIMDYKKGKPTNGTAIAFIVMMVRRKISGNNI